MKLHVIKKMILILIAAIGITGCRDLDTVEIDNQSAPIVVDLSSASVFLDKNFPSNPVLTVHWTKATYTVPTEIRYKVEVSADSEFTTPFLLGTVIESATSVTYTTEQMNEAAKAIGLLPDVSAKMYLRIIAFVGNSTEYLLTTSQVTSLNITPYELVYPDFYLVGAASHVGWNAANAQLFYKSGSTSIMYTYLGTGTGTGDAFRFLGQQDWNPINYSLDDPGVKDSYKYFKQHSSNISDDAGNDENMILTSASGIYKIVIDATAGVQSLSATPSPINMFDVPNLYLVGTINGNGWNAASAIPMTKDGIGKFSYITTLPNGTEFKILGQQDFGALEWGNIMSNNNGNSGYLGPKGDNGNISFDGADSMYKISVDLKAGTYSIVLQ